MFKFKYICIAIICVLVGILCYRLDNYIELQANHRAQILAEKLCADYTHEKVSALGHKYCDMILSQGVMFIDKNETPRGNKIPQVLTKNNTYIEKYMVLETTAYWTHDPIEASGNGIAFDGTPAVAFKTCAVDPKVIPLGSEIYFPSIGWCRANDTGSLINGHIADIAMPSREEAWKWGRRYCYCKVRIPAQKIVKGEE